MFGSAFGQNKPAGGLFGAPLNTNTQQTGGGLFGQSTQQNQPQQTGGLFGGALGQSTQQQPQQGGGLFGSTQNQAQPQQTGGLFGQSTQQQQPQQSSLFGGALGQNQQNQPQQGGLFGGGAFGQSQQNQQPQQGGLFGGQQNQQQQQGGGLFGGANQNQQPQQSSLFGGSTQFNNFGQSAQQQQPLGNSLWQPNSDINPREKSIKDQIETVASKWMVDNPNCEFKHYFYNKSDNPNFTLYETPANHDPKAWEEAVSKKPGKGYMPVLSVGFAMIGERIKNQQLHLAAFNARLHDINTNLSQMMQEHETRTSIRALDARKRHIALKQRCLRLATKVQVLRNRGYAMGGDEEDLRSKLMALERNVSDPGLGARGEEIWARMLIVQERAGLLRREIERSGGETTEVLGEEMSRRAKKILEDYNTQLAHLKTEIEAINQEFVEWQKEQAPAS